MIESILSGIKTGYTYIARKLANTRISELIQRTLWTLSMLSILLYFKVLYEQQPADASVKSLIVIVFGAATIIQQFFVYRNIHNIENNVNDYTLVYGEWIDKGLEKFFRYMILFSLLFSAGMVTGAVYPWFSNKGTEFKRGYFYGLIHPEGDYHNDLFIVGACSVFLFLILWNGFAFFSQKHTSTDKPLKSWVATRIFLYALSAVFAAIYWLVVFFIGSNLGDVATGLILAYFVTVLISSLLSSEKVMGSVIQTYSKD